MKLVNDELPVFSLYFNYLVMAHVSALSGPRLRSPLGSGLSNVHEWQWSS
jgi:hypothetical protein